MFSATLNALVFHRSMAVSGSSLPGLLPRHHTLGGIRSMRDPSTYLPSGISRRIRINNLHIFKNKLYI